MEIHTDDYDTTMHAPADPWRRLHDGPILLKADERARGAIEYRPESIPPVVDDTASPELLPQLGYRLDPTVYPAWRTGPRQSHTWKRHHTFSTFLLHLHMKLASSITNECRDDGTVWQPLPTEQAIAA